MDGYCSHDADQRCPNCQNLYQTYYVVNSVALSEHPLNRQKHRILYWLGREAETDDEKEEVEQLNFLLRQNSFSV